MAPVVLSVASVASICTSYPVLSAALGSVVAGNPTITPELSSPGIIQSSLSEYERNSLLLYQSMPIPPVEVRVALLLAKLPGPACDQPVVEPLYNEV